MPEVPFLKRGDKTTVLSTARKVEPADLEASLKVMQSWGLLVHQGNSIGKVQDQFAGSDQVRAADLQAALDDESVRAIFCARGGYGTIRIIDKLDFTSFARNPKWIIGYSDVTVLHSHIQARYSMPAVHGVMPSIFRFDEAGMRAQETLRKAVFGERLEYMVPHAYGVFRTGISEGILTGGNLSILYSLVGSVSDVNTDGKILFIEDLDEYLYHVDRMMLALKRAGKLSRLKGLIVGGMTEMNDNDTPFGKTAEEIILDHVKDYSYPVCFKFPAGHIRNNHALRLGTKISFAVTSLDVIIKFI